MHSKIMLDLDALQIERDELRCQLARLEAVIEYARRKGSNENGLKRVHLSQSRRGSLAEFIRRIVAEKGPIRSRDVVRLVQAETPTARAGSIRSTCSLLRRRGIFKLRGEKWSNVDSEKKDSGTAATVPESEA